MLEILLPFWGEPELLFKTVDSVLKQDDPRWRLTVVDDNYPDESVPRYFADLKDPRVRYLRNETNLGITKNYQCCLELAEQEILVFLGCDDIMHPDFVRHVLALHERFPEVDVIQPGVEVIAKDDRPVKPLSDRVKRWVMPRARGPRVLSGEALAVSLLHADWLYWPSLVFRREAIVSTPFRSGFPIIQDLALVIDMIVGGSELLLDPHICFSYRRHDSSASTTALLDGRRFRGEREYFELAGKIVRAKGWFKAERAARLHMTSRLHAIALLPAAVRSGHASALKELLAHALT